MLPVVLQPVLFHHFRPDLSDLLCPVLDLDS